jgi:hypothetical protein
MIKTIFLMSAISLSGLLSGCNTVLNALIPDQPITNPFGLNNRDITLKMERPADPLAKVEAASYFGGLSSSFINLSPSILGEARPTGIEEKLALASTLKVSSVFANNASDPQAVFPESLTLATARLAFKVVDGPEGSSLEEVFNSVPDVVLVMTKQACVTGSSKTTCTYLTGAEVTLFQLQFLGENFNTLFDIITAGGQPNTISGNLNFEFMGASFPPLDSEITLVLKTSDGKLKF